jgi:corrinoid protein of di/trimethylamine methyltransferase
VRKLPNTINPESTKEKEEFMGEEKIYETLRKAILDGDGESLLKATEAGLSGNISPTAMIDKMTETMKEVGQKFESGDVFLPEMIRAADAWKKAMAVLEPKLSARELEKRKAGRIVIGTVKSDIHDLGKNIVIAFLKTVGFEIMDLGIDVPASKFISAAAEFRADIIGMSSLLATSMPYQKDVIEHLTARNLRNKYKVIVGGGPVNKGWADAIGADGYARDAAEAAKLCSSLVKS